MNPRQVAFSWLAGEAKRCIAAFGEGVGSLLQRLLLIAGLLYPGLKLISATAGALTVAVLGAYLWEGLSQGSWDVTLTFPLPLLHLATRHPLPSVVTLAFCVALVSTARVGYLRRYAEQKLRKEFRVYAPAHRLKLSDLDAQQDERPFFGTYFPRKLLDDTDAGEIDAAMNREYTEQDLARLLQANQGFLVVDHLYAGKTLTLFRLLRMMTDHVVVIPDSARPVPSSEVFRLLKGRKVVVVLDDLISYAQTGYDLALFSLRVSQNTGGSYAVAATCRDGAAYTSIVADYANPVTYFCEDRLRLKLRLQPMTVDERRALARTTNWDLNLLEARLYPYPGNITLRERTAVMGARFRVLAEPEKDVLRAMKLLDDGAIPVTVQRVLVTLGSVFDRHFDPNQIEVILRRLWEHSFLLEQPGASAVAPHFGHLAFAVSYREGFTPEEDHWDQLIEAFEKNSDADALAYMGTAFGHRGDLTRSLFALDAGLRADPEQAYLHYCRGYGLARVGRIEEALEANARALELRPGFPEAYNNRCYILSLGGRLPEALVAVERALELRPQYEDAHVNRAIVLARLHRFDEAINEFNLALRLRPESYYAYLNLGITLSRQGSFEEALTAFERALVLRPDYAEAHLNRGITLARMKRFEAALGAQRRAVELDPEYPQAYMQLGQTLANLQRYGEAIDALNRAIELRRDYGEAYAKRGRTLRHMGPQHREAASKDWAKALALGLSIPKSSIGVAASLAAIGAFDQAIGIFDRLVDFYPNDPDAHLHRGITLARMDRFDDALADFARALELRPDHAQAHLNRAITLARMERFDHALADFARALELRPDSAEVHFNRGQTLSRMDRFDDALADFARALELRPDYVEVHFNRGQTLSRMDRFDDALADFARALELRADHAEAHLNRAITLARMDRFDDALADFARALELRPDSAEAHLDRGIALAHMDRFDDALADFARALELRPDRAEAHLNRAITLARIDRFDDALADFARVLELRPDSAEAHLNRGIALARLERFGEALADFARALELRPDYAEAHLNRATTLTRMERFDEALDAVNSALAVRPDLADAHYTYGLVLTTMKGFDRSRLERALGAYEEAARLRPGYAHAHRERGFLLAQLGRDELALDAYEQAIRLHPRFPEALFGKARALCFLARKNLHRFPRSECFCVAMDLLEQAKTLDPDYVGRSAAKDKHAFRELRCDPNYADRFRALIWD